MTPLTGEGILSPRYCSTLHTHQDNSFNDNGTFTMPAHETYYQGKELSIDKAVELSQCRDTVRLAVDRLECKAAKALERFEGKILHIEGHLPVLDHCSADCLIALGDRGKLRLDWVIAGQHTGHLEKAMILSLVRFADSANLEGIDALDAKDAHILQSFTGTQLLLYLKALSPEAADRLAKASPELLLISIPSISQETAHALADSRAREEFQLYLGDDSLTPEIASELARFNVERLTLDCPRMDAASAARLAEFDLTLRLQCPGITTEAIKALTSSSAGLELFLDDFILEQDLAEAIVNGDNAFIHFYEIKSLGTGVSSLLESTNKEIYIENTVGEVYDFS